MTIINDNQDPERRPDAPAPTGLNRSVPSRSDTVEYVGPLCHTQPSVWGEFPNEVTVVFRRITRQRTWTNLAQFHTSAQFGGNYDEQATEGVSTATGVVERWEQALGVEVGVEWGPLSAKMSASLSVGGEQSVTVELYHSISRTIHFNFNKGIEAEVAAWQLEENYLLDTWRVIWNIEGADPSKVSDAMIAAAREELEQALRDGRKPRFRGGRHPALLVATNQYTLTSFPPLPASEARLMVQ